MATTLKTARETILDLLQDNLTDPESRNDSTWIRGVGAGNQDSFVGYPVISVGHLSADNPTKSFSRNSRFRNAEIIIMIYTSNDIQLETLTDSVVNIIESNEVTLNTAGLNNVSVNVGVGDFLLEVGDELHSLPVTVSFVI